MRSKKRNIYLDNLPLEEALEKWQQALSESGCLKLIDAVEVRADDASGRITADPIFAPNSAPFYNAAAMDGIAVRYRETIGASESSPLQLTTPEQYRPVNTGNAMPEGFDAVIMIEDVHEIDHRTVEITAAVTPWKHVRAIGEDIVRTEMILPAGHRIRPIDIGAILATGITAVRVRRRPDVLVIPTGSELVQPGEPVKPGNIIEFNSRILCGYLCEWGARALRSEIVSDNPVQLKKALEKAVHEHDVVVINAGASAGTEDHTVKVLGKLGKIIVHGINIRPGKPVILAIVNGKPVIGLPGYPVSALLTQRLFVKPLLEAISDSRSEPPTLADAVLSRPYPSKLGSEEFVRVRLGRVGGKLIATPAGRGAGAVMSMVLADGIMRIPASSEGIGAGETVSVEMLRRPDEVEDTLVFIGSHDNILDVLANRLTRKDPPCRLSSAHVGSMGGIMAIKRGEAHLTGTHLLDEESSEYNVPFIRKHLANLPLILVNLAFREQGFLVRPGNPLNITTFADLTREDVSFINRQRGAGTRLLTDLHLKKAGIRASDVRGYDREEYTHMNVASAVAGGTADTGLGIRAAAVALDLDFIPVAMERYDIIVPKPLLKDPKIITLLETIRTDNEFRETVGGLGGYDLSESGSIVYEQ